MKIMLIEDNKSKQNDILEHLLSKNIQRKDIVVVENLTDFFAKENSEIGLFIIDIRIPNVDDSNASQNGKTIVEALVKKGRNDASLLAISSYPEDFTHLRPYFEMHGCILCDFKETKSWKSTLDHLLVQSRREIKFDFLIFCALEEERNPYIAWFPDGRRSIRGGIECFDIEVAGKSGSVILHSKMGLVNAAAVSAVSIDRYRPNLVAMSGICGGFKSRASLGQLLISEMAYEYQSGKWTGDGFSQEPYQVPTEHGLLTSLRKLSDDEDLLSVLEMGFKGTRPSEQNKPKMAVFTSGSAVIAEKKYLDQVEIIHRKVSGLDMEVFALQRSAHLSVTNPPCICAKAVVDLCDDEKSDRIHAYGSFISARFVIKAIENHYGKPTH